MIRTIQYLAAAAGLGLVAWFAIDAYARDREADAAIASLLSDEMPDTSLWSATRVRDYAPARESLIGVLRIDAIGLEAPVVAGTDETPLNQGVGWLKSSAAPGSEGNVVLAAHRDGFFRGLKDLKPDAVVELVTGAANTNYRVDEMIIVDPEDVWVLQNDGVAELTLITCYPFYFVGSAPKRFVVRAKHISTQPVRGVSTL